MTPMPEISEGWTAPRKGCAACRAEFVREIKRLTLRLTTYRLPWYRWLWYEIRLVFSNPKQEVKQ